ncbi:hypothetical protein [Streptomyces tendae]|uniref:hypothetical protein n=1 Tax=Streptomyces tendae TaxID=1932 RepID=UPI0033B9CFF4
MLLGVMVRGENTSDRVATKALLLQVADARHRLGIVWAGGNTNSLVERRLTTFVLVLAIVERSDDTRDFVVLPEWWIVERIAARPALGQSTARPAVSPSTETPPPLTVPSPGQ